MKTVLFLSQALPFPPDTGATRRTLNILRQLGQTFRVSLVAFSRRAHQPDEPARLTAERALAEHVARVFPSVRFPGEWSRFRRAWDHVRGGVSGRPYSYFQYGSEEFGVPLDEALGAEKPDLVHLDSLDFYRWLPKFDGVPTTCTHHDIESHALLRRADATGNRLLSAYVRRQANLVRGVEAKWCPRVQLNWTVSPEDSTRLREIAPGARIAEAPNAVDLEDFPLPRSGEVEENSVVFVGATYLFANRDAVGFLLDAVWPEVRRIRPEATLTLVGGNAPGEARKFRQAPGVHPVGNVDRVQPYLARAACSVVPIRTGGGTRLKILESWALGKAVVTTTVGGEGLAIRDGETAIVRDDPSELATSIVRVLDDRALRERLGKQGRLEVERKYTWDAVGREMRGRYEELMQSASERALLQGTNLANARTRLEPERGGR